MTLLGRICNCFRKPAQQETAAPAAAPVLGALAPVEPAPVPLPAQQIPNQIDARAPLQPAAPNNFFDEIAIEELPARLFRAQAEADEMDEANVAEIDVFQDEQREVFEDQLGQAFDLGDREQAEFGELNDAFRDFLPDEQAQRPPAFYLDPELLRVMVLEMMAPNNAANVNRPEQDLINVDTHQRDLVNNQTGYPGLYRQLNSTIGNSNTTLMNTTQIKRAMTKEIQTQLQQQKMTELTAQRVQAAMTYMFDSDAAQHQIMDFPQDIILQDVLAKTWLYCQESTQNKPAQRQEANQALFNQLEEAQTGLLGQASCSTGHASRTLQTLSICFPDTFKEPVTFENARNAMKSLTDQLLQQDIRNHHRGLLGPN